MLQHNLIKNTPVTYDDALRTETTFGPDLGSLKGKSVCSTSAPIILSTSVSIAIFEHHTHVCISADIFYMDGAIFFMTISRHLQFKTVHFIESKKHDVIYKCFSQVIYTYKTCGFLVSIIISDHEFEPLSRQLLEFGATLNVSTADEHASEIERAIRVIKERARAHLIMMPFPHYPRLLKRHLIHHLITLVNLSVHPNSVFPYLSPATIIIGHTFDAYIHCRVKFGLYCQAFDEPSPLNSTVKPRTLDTLALRPTGNRQGGYYFLHIIIWSLIESSKWTVIPIPEHIISLVNELNLSVVIDIFSRPWPLMTQTYWLCPVRLKERRMAPLISLLLVMFLCKMTTRIRMTLLLQPPMPILSPVLSQLMIIIIRRTQMHHPSIVMMMMLTLFMTLNLSRSVNLTMIQIIILLCLQHPNYHPTTMM